MSSIGIKISKPGVDVKTADDDELVWSSDFKTFKLYRIVKFTSTGSQSHGLDYPPAFAITNPPRLVDEAYPGKFDLMLGQNYVQVDDTKVYCTLRPKSEDVYVILFIDPLDE